MSKALQRGLDLSSAAVGTGVTSSRILPPSVPVGRCRPELGPCGTSKARVIRGLLAVDVGHLCVVQT